MTQSVPSTTWFADQVRLEIARAEEKFPGQVETVNLAGWLAILVEEVGEVARALNEHELGASRRRLYAELTNELVQVGAMAEKMHRAAMHQLSEVK